MSAYNPPKHSYNIYGVLQSSSVDSTTVGPGQMIAHSISPSSSLSSTRSKLTEFIGPRVQFQFDREITTISQMNFPVSYKGFESPTVNQVVVGGRNCLRLLGLNDDQSKIVQDINILDQHPVTSTSKLNNVNTIKCQLDVIACGLTNGVILVYKMHPNGKSMLLNKFSDHKRCINSIDFLKEESGRQIISGSQDGLIKLWDIRVGVTKPQITVSSNTHSDPIRSCQYSPHSVVRNKLTVLSAHDSGALCKYDLRSSGGTFTHNGSSNSHFQPERKWNLHTGPALSLHIHPEKEYVLTGGRDQKMCVWNYGDSAASLHKITPEYMLNTYSPVMKVRWCNYPNIQTDFTGESVDSYLDFEKYDEREAVFAAAASANNSLYNYDFAALYLNDDSTITVHNLSRKYLPVEIINSQSKKPFQNFIWGNSLTGARKIWSVTKANVFTAHELDGLNSAIDPDISRPLDELSPVAFDWNIGAGDFCFVNQERYEFEVNDNASDIEETQEAYDDLETRSVEVDRKHVGSIPIASNIGVHPFSSQPHTPATPLQSSYSSLTSSPIEKPQMFRASTHNPMTIGKSPSPVLQHRTTSPFTTVLSERPKLNRNGSNATQDSLASVTPKEAVTSKNKYVQVNYALPYLIPMRLPLPRNDEEVFQTLAKNYLIYIPDGFSLIDVCLMNASVSGSVGNYRDCQVWRVLAVSLEEDFDGQMEQDTAVPRESGDYDTRSMTSELGQFVGSYNSNSTLTTNYGSGGKYANTIVGSAGSGNIDSTPAIPVDIKKENPENSHSLLSVSPESWKFPENKSSTNLMDLINQSRGNSFSSNSNPLKLKKRLAGATVEAEPMKEPTKDIAADANSTANSPAPDTSSDRANELENESAIMDDEDPKKLTLQTKLHYSNSIKSRTSSSRFRRPSHSEFHATSPIRIRSPEDTVPTTAGFSYQKRSIILPASLQEDETLHGNSHEPISGYFPPNPLVTLGHSFSQLALTDSPALRRNLSINGFLKFRNSPQLSRHEPLLEQHEEHKSELSKAIQEDKVRMKFKPWKTQSILKKTLQYASSQGDIIMCATLTLLFYDYFLSKEAKASSLDWLSLYVDILQRKRLFVAASNVINMSPREILDRLKELSKDVDLRFYCCWCQKLMINESSKMKANEDPETNFGYWYCDECSRQQLNCVYCNEPCKGLTVVVSLKCGHRGHFGCLKEWFIVEENVECPGGCDYSVV